MNKNILLLPASALLLIACGGSTTPTQEFEGEKVTDSAEVVAAMNKAIAGLDLSKGISASLSLDADINQNMDAALQMPPEGSALLSAKIDGLKAEAKIAGLRNSGTYPTTGLYAEASLKGSIDASLTITAGTMEQKTPFKFESLDETVHLKDNVFYFDLSEDVRATIASFLTLAGGGSADTAAIDSSSPALNLPEQFKVDVGVGEVSGINIPDSLGEYEQVITQMLTPNAMPFLTVEVEKDGDLYNVDATIKAKEYNDFLEQMMQGSGAVGTLPPSLEELPTIAKDFTTTFRFSENGTEFHLFLSDYEVEMMGATSKIENFAASIEIGEVDTSWTPGDGYEALPIK